MIKPGVIRPLAVCIIKDEGRLLVTVSRDSFKKENYCRLLGGGIEFGETGEEALRREFKEELGTDLENVKYLTSMENIFTYEGKPGHEIDLLFEADLTNKELYKKDNIQILDNNEGGAATWQKISDFKDKKLILYPSVSLQYL
ncbi:MAG TPA: NUDIX domain-containing protein [Patescibacteria group bacterium]|nr:NUDIX domain-containing protein [Patescibacteria group bacterium]